MPTLVLADLHLLSTGDPAPARDLAALLVAERDAHVVFAGDALDLAAEGAASPTAAVQRSLSRAPELTAALSERAGRGVRTTFVRGNHDAALATVEGRRALHDALGLSPSDRGSVVCEPWLVRLAGGAVHVEHGHVFDPDSAPSHPLAPDPRDDVGICILRRFIVPVGAHALVHRNSEAPLPLLARVVRMFGPRAPLIVARYVAAALGTVVASGKRFPLLDDRARGGELLRLYAEDAGMDSETLEMLVGAHATPTRARATATFLRLYLDRVAATGALVAGGALGLATSGAMGHAGMSIAALGALSLAGSIVLGANRYAGRTHRALAEGAERTAEITGARTVVLGHVHVDAEGPRYRNTASFAFAKRPEGRPYLRVEDDGSVARAWA